MNIYISFIILYSSISFADTVPCNNQFKQNDLSKTISDCKIQKELVKDKLVQNEHYKIISTKLADKLALQIKQNSEEFSLLTTFFNNNKSDLLMGSDHIAKNCQLNKFKSIETCEGKAKSSVYKLKLDRLKKTLIKSNGTEFNDSNKSLYDIVSNKFIADLGLSEKKQTSCPINDKLSNFSINGQLDDISADYIVDKIKNGTSAFDKRLYDQFPQLKLIYNTDNEEFKQSFINHIKNKPTNILANDYIAAFFTDKKNHKTLSTALGDQCKKMNENLDNFLCSDLDDLGTLDSMISQDLFNNLNTEEPLEDQYLVEIDNPGVLTAYGLQCLKKEELSSNSSIKSKNNSSHSLDNWFNDFTKKTRAELSNEKGVVQSAAFCSHYNCQSDVSKNALSCQKGGPITSTDLDLLFGCSETPSRKKDCDVDNSKMIKFLKGLENLRNDSHAIISKNENKNNSTSAKSEFKLPSFAANFLGSEGSLNAIGVKPTIETINETKKTIENKIANNINDHKSEMLDKNSNLNSRDSVKNENTDVNHQSAIQTADRIASAPAYARAIPPTPKSAINSNNYKVQPTPAASTESTRLRREMEDMLKDLKSNPNLAAANSDSGTGDSNSATSPNDSSPTKKQASGSTTIKSRAEEERLERYAKQLDQRERDLNDYKDKLDNQAYSRTVSDDSNESQKSLLPKSGIAGAGAVSDTAGSNSSSSGSSSAGSTGSSSLKLTAANPKAEQKTNTAAIIQSGKETSTLSVEELTTLSPDNLQNLGIDSTKPFTLRVNFKAKTYEVPVKTLQYKGRNILGPVIDPKNIDLKDMLLKSPLFRPFQEYRLEREKQVL